MSALVSGPAFVAGAWLLQQCARLPPAQTTIALAAAAVLARVLVPRLIDRRRPRAASLPGAAAADGLRLACGAIVWLAAGFCWAAAVAHLALADRLAPALEGHDLRVRGVVEGLPLRGEHGWTFRFALERAVDPPAIALPAAIRLTLPDAPAREGVGETPPQAPPRAGERWEWTVRLRPPHAPANPHGFDGELRALEEGIGAVGSVRPGRGDTPMPARIDPLAATPAALLGRWREHVRDAVVAAAGDAHPLGRGMLAALTVGDQAALPNRVWTAFNRTGVGHLMSISGLHITMLAALGAALAARCWRMRWVARRGWPLRCPRQQVALAASVATAAAYSLLAGWGIPAQRTFWMLAVAAAARAGGRPAPVGATLALAAAVVCALDPWAPLAPGFWLSFAAVAALVWALSRDAPRPARAATLRGRVNARLQAALSAGIGSQVAATVALLPMSVAFFGSVSVVSPLVNAVAIPLVAGVLTPVVLAGAALAAMTPEAGAWLLQPCAWLAQRSAEALLQLSDWSWAALPVARPSAIAWWLSVLAVAAMLAPPALRLRPLAACALLPLLLGPRELPADGELRLTALDVGQGMAILVEAGARALLYDAGPAWSADSDAGARIVLPDLRARGIGRLDALVISHRDTDHAGGALSVLQEVAVDRVASSLAPDHPVVERAGGVHEPCRAGRSWKWEQVEFAWLHPTADAMPDADENDRTGRAGYADRAGRRGSADLLPGSGGTAPRLAGRPASGNARSCVLRIAAPGGVVLLAGDIEAAQEAALLAREPAARLRADVLVAPHHGSRTSSTAAFLEAVRPSWAVFQVGYRNRFGHPHPAVASRYDALGAVTLRTDRDGAVAIRLRPGRPAEVTRERFDTPRYWRVAWTDPPAKARPRPPATRSATPADSATRPMPPVGSKSAAPAGPQPMWPAGPATPAASTGSANAATPADSDPP